MQRDDQTDDRPGPDEEEAAGGAGAEHPPATGPEGVDAGPEGLEERVPGGGEPPGE